MAGFATSRDGRFAASDRRAALLAPAFRLGLRQTAQDAPGTAAAFAAVLTVADVPRAAPAQRAALAQALASRGESLADVLALCVHALDVATGATGWTPRAGLAVAPAELAAAMATRWLARGDLGGWRQRFALARDAASPAWSDCGPAGHPVWARHVQDAVAELVSPIARRSGDVPQLDAETVRRQEAARVAERDRGRLDDSLAGLIRRDEPAAVAEIRRRLAAGETWPTLAREVAAALGASAWVPIMGSMRALVRASEVKGTGVA